MFFLVFHCTRSFSSILIRDVLITDAFHMTRMFLHPNFLRFFLSKINYEPLVWSIRPIIDRLLILSEKCYATSYRYSKRDFRSFSRVASETYLRLALTNMRAVHCFASNKRDCENKSKDALLRKKDVCIYEQDMRSTRAWNV